jgi:hypothetical protein
MVRVTSSNPGSVTPTGKINWRYNFHVWHFAGNFPAQDVSDTRNEGAETGG